MKVAGYKDVQGFVREESGGGEGEPVGEKGVVGGEGGGPGGRGEGSAEADGGVGSNGGQEQRRHVFLSLYSWSEMEWEQRLYCVLFSGRFVCHGVCR